GRKCEVDCNNKKSVAGSCRMIECCRRPATEVKRKVRSGSVLWAVLGQGHSLHCWAACVQCGFRILRLHSSLNFEKPAGAQRAIQWRWTRARGRRAGTRRMQRRE